MKSSKQKKSRQLQLTSTHLKYIIITGAFLLIAGAGIAYRGHSPSSSTKSAALAPTDKCQYLNSQTENLYGCYKNELTNIVKTSGAEPAIKLIKKQNATVPYVQSSCHQMMHIIGRAAYAKYGNLGDTFAHGDQYCNGGYYHGLSEELGDENGASYLRKNANTLCSQIAAKKGRYSFYHYNCVHGLGHAFMEVLDGELYQSLDGCDLISDDWERSSCYGGVFMQNIMIEQSPDESVNHTSKYLKLDDPMYPCTVVDTKYKEQCYLMQTSHALAIEGNDFPTVFRLCEAADTDFQATCYRSLGRDASGQSVYTAQKAQALCLMGTNDAGITNCIYGAAQDFVNNFQSDKQALQICENLPPGIAVDCAEKIKTFYSILF